MRSSLVAALLAGCLLVGACSDDGGATDPTSTTAPGPSPTEVSAGLCAAAPHPVTPAPMVESTLLTELSGLVASRTNDGVWWALNDSGDEARLYAVGPDGEDLGTVVVDGAQNVDWEDLAIGPGPDGDLLYIADIGNNIADRAVVPVHVVAEPDLSGGVPGTVTVERTVELEWPSAAIDAEVLLVDPRDGAIVIVTKRFGSPSEVFAADGGDAGPVLLREVGTVDIAAAATLPPDAPVSTALGLGAATAGDVTARGDVVLLRTYGAALVWPREADQTLAEAIVGNTPCQAPTAVETQGEAIAVDPDAGGYRTISEGVRPPVNRFTAAG